MRKLLTIIMLATIVLMSALFIKQPIIQGKNADMENSYTTSDAFSSAKSSRQKLRSNVEDRYIGEALNTVERDGKINVYLEKNEKSEVIHVLKDYDKVEILETLPYGWYKVKLKNGQVGFADATYIRAKEIPEHGYDKNSGEWVLIFSHKDQTLEIYNNGKLVEKSIASSGIWNSFTPKGVFQIEKGKRGEWSYVPRFEQGMKYWVGFKGSSYLFHSIPYNKDKELIVEEAEKLGRPSSHGCIRLPVSVSKFIYEEVPDGALVIIN